VALPPPASASYAILSMSCAYTGLRNFGSNIIEETKNNEIINIHLNRLINL
jgi:hypothetical protein